MAFARASPGCFLCLVYSERSCDKVYRELSIYKGFAADIVSSRSCATGAFSWLSTASHSVHIADCATSGKSSSRWRLNSIGFDTPVRIRTDTRTLGDNSFARSTALEIPVTCFQLIGIPDRSEKDEIVKSVMDLKNAEIEEGYTMSAVVSRQDLLMDVRDKLLFESEYCGSIKDNVPPKSSVGIPWSWLPGALCLLQEVGEVKIVVDIGNALVRHPDAKPYVHDILLAMALAECSTAKICLEKNMVSQGFEALARAQSLMRSQASLGKLTLLFQVEESLEELAPACTLELLGMPHSLENAERRQGAIAALRELLRQGLDVETSCQVQDWPCFLSQAFSRLLATEIVHLLPWDDLVSVRKNKKSIESQNQKVIIDFNCFYMALMAHLALGFSSRQIELITKAKSMCECLIASEGIDLKLEEAFCSFLLGQGKEIDVIEKLQQLEIRSTPSTQMTISMNPTKDSNISKQSLEVWVKDAVLSPFADTRDCPSTMVSFFSGEKNTAANNQSKRFPRTVINASERSMPTAFLSEKRDIGESFERFGTVVKQLAPADSKSSVLNKNNGKYNSLPSIQLKRDLGMHHTQIWEGWFRQGHLVSGITLLVVAGCIILTKLKFTSLKSHYLGKASKSPIETSMHKNGLVAMDVSLANGIALPYTKAKGIPGTFRKILGMLKKESRSSLNTEIQDKSVHRRTMSVEEAETLVKKWQAVKAKALGPKHKVHCLFEILDELMLVQWQALADAAKAKPCYWRFVLLQLSVQRAEVLSNETGVMMAEIEALLEEAAELVDESETSYPSYYSTYKVRYVLKQQADGSWRFCEVDVLSSS